jgi:hypothetical protein
MGAQGVTAPKLLASATIISMDHQRTSGSAGWHQGVLESGHILTLVGRCDLARLLDSHCGRNTGLLPSMAARERPMQNATLMLDDIITETLLLGTQRQLQETQPHLSVLARVRRAEALVDEMLPDERADYFVWLASRQGVASPTA